MARETQARPALRERLGKWDASRAGDLVGVKTQDVPDGSTAGNDVEADPEANLHVSREATDAHAFVGLDLTDEAVQPIPHTFKRSAAATEVTTITLAQPIDGNTSYTLDTAGAAITVMPVVGSPTPAWELVAAIGTVTAVP